MPQPTDRQRMEQALRAADAAGDTAAATQLAQAIRALPPASSAQPSARPFVGPRDQRQYTTGQALTGMADVAISSARHLVNKPAGTLAGIIGGINPNDTYLGARDRFRQAAATDQLLVRDDRLRTPEGQTVATGLSAMPQHPIVGAVGAAAGAAGDWIGRTFGPEAQDAAGSAAMLATLRAPRAAAAPGRAPLTAEGVAARSTRGDSAGASAAAVDVSSVTPDLRQAVVAAGRGGRGVAPDALSRHVEADTLPVPIRLTAGEARMDPILLSQERNLRGRHPDMVSRMDETNRALGQNLQAVRDKVGDQVFSTNMVEHGDTLISAYRAKDAAAEANIDALYGQLRGALGSQVPINAKALWGNVRSALHKDLMFDHAPAPIVRKLEELANSNSMTFENFESLRTQLARIQRSPSADGNLKAAAGIIRSQMEDLPLMPGSGADRMKPIADAARAAARARFKALESDPAYAAAVDGSVPPDRFVQKFVLGAPRDQLAALSRTFQNDPIVRQTMSVAVLDHLRDAARLDQGYAGNFSAAGFSRALSQLDPKANLIFDAQTAETLSKLRNVAGYTTFQPRGSFVNNSNTLVGSLADYGGQAAEGAITYATLGLGAPVARYVGRKIKEAPDRRLIRNSLQRGAGLEQPRNALARPKQP